MGFIQEELKNLDDNGLRRKLRTINGAQGPRVNVNGREVLNFCSNNYLGLADDSRLVEAAVRSMGEQGFGSGASRLVCGNMSAHRLLEEKIARMKGAEDCVLFSTGYMANVGIISGLFGRGDVIFSDRLNHASIIDGIILSRAGFKRYPHKDVSALERMLTESDGAARKLIVTDSVFSMDGDIAPLDKLAVLAEKHNCTLMIDEAHAFGVMGPNGKGLAEHFGLEGKIDIQMGTLSKAAGSFGAYCCGSKDMISFLINKARSFIYTTGMPPSVAAASLKALEIMERQPRLRRLLWKNTGYVKKRLSTLGFDTMDSRTPIIPVLVKDPEKAVRLSGELLEYGILISAIRPPAVPSGTSRLRLTVMSSHTRDELDYLIQSLEKAGRNQCLI